MSHPRQVSRAIRGCDADAMRYSSRLYAFDRRVSRDIRQVISHSGHVHGEPRQADRRRAEGGQDDGVRPAAQPRTAGDEVPPGGQRQGQELLVSTGRSRPEHDPPQDLGQRRRAVLGSARVVREAAPCAHPRRLRLAPAHYASTADRFMEAGIAGRLPRSCSWRPTRKSVSSCSEPCPRSKSTKFSLHFLWTEWSRVVDAWQLASWEQYRDVPRLGRKTLLSERQRAVLWSISSRVSAALDERGLLTEPRLLGRLERRLPKLAHPPFQFCVIDEGPGHQRGRTAVPGCHRCHAPRLAVLRRRPGPEDFPDAVLLAGVGGRHQGSLTDPERLTGLPGLVWMRRPEVAGSGAARLRWSHAWQGAVREDSEH